MKKETFGPLWKPILYLIGFCLACLVLIHCTGCMTTEKHRIKTERQLNEAYYFFPDIVGNKCNIWFPFRPTTSTTKSDTVTVEKEVPGDTVYVDCPDGTKKQAPCPPNKVRNNYIHDTTRIVGIDSPAMFLMKHQRDKAIADADKAEDGERKAKEKLATRTENMWWAIGIAAALFLYSVVRIVLRFKSKIALP